MSETNELTARGAPPGNGWLDSRALGGVPWVVRQA
jgi:hypothetical protein